MRARTTPGARNLASTRRGALVAATVAALLLTSACAQDAPEPDDAGGDVESVGGFSMAYFTTVFDGQVKLAEEQGILAAHGLGPVEYVASESAPAALTALVTGSVDIATAIPVSAFPLIEGGEDIVMLMNTWTEPMQLIVTPEVGAEASGTYPENIEALVGKDIGVTARGSLGESFVTRMVLDAGLQATDVNFVAVGGMQAGVAAWTAGQIDAMVAFTPLTELLDADSFEILVDSESTVDDVYGTAPILTLWATTRAFLEEKPDVVKAFCDSMWETQEFARDDANLQTVADFIQSEIATSFTDEQALTFAEEKYAKYYDLALSEELWQAQADADLLPEGVPLPDYADSVLEDCASPR